MNHPADLVDPAGGLDEEAYDRLRRRVLWRMPGGLYLVGSAAGSERNVMTANLVVQVCVEPKLVAVAVERSARTNELVREGGGFCVGFVSRDDRALVRKFVKPAIDDRSARTLNGYPYLDAPVTGSPLLVSSVAYLDCRLDQSIELGSHTLFVGEVAACGFGPAEGGEEAEVLRGEDTRMSYGG